MKIVRVVAALAGLALALSGVDAAQAARPAPVTITGNGPNQALCSTDSGTCSSSWDLTVSGLNVRQTVYLRVLSPYQDPDQEWRGTASNGVYSSPAWAYCDDVFQVFRDKARTDLLAQATLLCTGYPSVPGS